MGWGSKALADKEDINNEEAEHHGSVMGIKTKADKEDIDNEPFVANHVDNEGAELRGSILNSIVADV